MAWRKGNYRRVDAAGAAVGRSLLNDANWMREVIASEPFAAFDPACLKIGNLA